MNNQDHQEFLIDQYNRNRLTKDHVKTMEELNRAILNNEIEKLKPMTKEKMLEKQNAIYVMTIDRLWEHLNPGRLEYEQGHIYQSPQDLEWIFEEMENELNKLQNENTGKVLDNLFNDWGRDYSANK